MPIPPRHQRLGLLLLVSAAASVLFLIGLGRTGLIDETPALFAASARAMAQGQDWVVPHVNGLPRYDKPPLVYWLMALGYAVPGQAHWDPLGTLAARIPSALASAMVMLLIADTLWRWPQTSRPASGSATLALSGAMAFGLGPLALVWGRTEVSDALFNGLLAMALLLAWRSYAAASPQSHWWCPLALATLTKGPVALVLVGLVLAVFGAMQGTQANVRQMIRPLRGLLLATLCAAPWFALVLMRDGMPYVRSFFGYHNLQRFSQVVNHHQQPWWYFAAVLLVGSLPYTPLLLLGLKRALPPMPPAAPEQSLDRFAACWLLVVLGFFSLSATKLPSYWLPATPAAALLVSLTLGVRVAPSRGETWALRVSSLLCCVLAAGLAITPLWLNRIDDPAVPELAAVLLRGPWFAIGSVVSMTAAALAAGLASRRSSTRLLQSQLALLVLVPLLLLPVAQRLDGLRGEPIRTLAAMAIRQREPGEALAMVGLMKPSLHFYSHSTVIYEGRSASALCNLADRLKQEARPGLQPSTAKEQPTALLLIDAITLGQPHWRELNGALLGQAGPYRLLRLDRLWLERRARDLAATGVGTNWRQPRPERY